jgi:hypothetical protein
MQDQPAPATDQPAVNAPAGTPHYGNFGHPADPNVPRVY